MRQSRTAVINTPIGGGFAIPTFDGSHAVFGDAGKGYIACYSSGTLTFPKDIMVDIFAVAGGRSGNAGTSSMTDNGYQQPMTSTATSGAGGQAGAFRTTFEVNIPAGSYNVTVGASNGDTAVGEFLSASGGYGTPGAAVTVSANTDQSGKSANGNPGSSGVNPFDDNVFVKLCGTGGSGAAVVNAADAIGGTASDGGGKGGSVKATGNSGSIYAEAGTFGTANTGGGGGGGAALRMGANTSFNKKGTGGAGGSGIVIIRWGYGAKTPTFSGRHAKFGTVEKGYIECYSSGMLSVAQDETVDVFILGSGLAGEKGTATGTGTSSVGTGSSTGGKGGGGATGKTIIGYAVKRGSYLITVGAACNSATTPNASSAFGETANTVLANGGRGGYTYAEWGTGDSSKNTSTSGSKGSSGSSYPFGESTLNAAVDPNSIWYKKQLGAGGGGGGARSSGWKYAGGYDGGVYGGGKGGKYSDGIQIDCAPGADNTGSGGGGGGSASYGDLLYEFDGGLGGSGIVIIRWGDWAS